MKAARWVDHLPPWLSFGAVLTTGAFSPFELAVMALPLAAAAVVEYRQWDLGRHRRLLEIAALVAVLAQGLLRIGLVVLTVNTLFVLCGIRLALPREAPQRRQLVLMGFLLFLVTAIATFEITFLFWALAWTAGAALVLLQQAWDAAAVHYRGLAPQPPYRAVARWTAAALVLAGFFFLVLPRQTLGLRFFPWGLGGLTGSAAGLSDRVELFDKGPIAGNTDVVLRILPPPGLPDPLREVYAEDLQLLRGITLEGLRGQRWESRPDTPDLRVPRGTEADWQRAARQPELRALEFFVAPNPLGLIPVPLGAVTTLPPPGMPLRAGSGGSLRWMFPSRRPLPLRLWFEPGRREAEPVPRDRRRALLTLAGEETLAARDWSTRIAPGPLPPLELARRLTADLRTFGYTTRNPSGAAKDPLRDFLERTRAGHCEYFASALALALRHRDIPARVVNGYRLGPWIQEGGYWLVTQDQAHSWVELYDAASGRWHTVDPTPAAPPSRLQAQDLWAAFQRWTDALRYRWDRRVVRFSGEDQLAGLSWIQDRASALADQKPEGRTLASLAALGLLSVVLWRLRRFRPRFGSSPSVHRVEALRPLLRRTRGQVPPSEGETLRAWLGRLAQHRPDLAQPLRDLAAEADAVAYAGRAEAPLRRLARRIAKAWTRP